MFDEDPAAFETLRSDLIEYYQPADPVSEHLIDQVAQCMWRLNRVPQASRSDPWLSASPN